MKNKDNKKKNQRKKPNTFTIAYDGRNQTSASIFTAGVSDKFHSLNSMQSDGIQLDNLRLSPNLMHSLVAKIKDNDTPN